MAKGAKTAWGIDLGNCTLKAIKLGLADEGVEVLDFAVIPHKKILSQPDLDPAQKDELIEQALTKLLEEHDLTGSAIVVSVPGQNSFARFIKLPPVETKRIPEIVRFEAIQQIPFDINDVEWDWQTFQHQPDNPEVEVGIFAIKKDLVNQSLEPFFRAGCSPTIVQMAPMALYNYLNYDQKRLRNAPGKQAIVTLDIGADNTDLVIADGLRVWQRSIPIGGNHFTAAVQKAFKLSFAKAEALKRTASTNKYARQIFQAMRSVFADLAAEVQRSLGFYSSSNRDVRFREVLAMGNAMKMPGLVKFLQQSLSLPVKRLDSFESLKLAPDVSVPQFSENLLSLAVVYGLALQAMGLGTIQSNLLPLEIARQDQWKKKRVWFAASVAVCMAGSFLSLFAAKSQQADSNSNLTQSSLRVIDTVTQSVKKSAADKKKFDKIIASANQEIKKRVKVYQSRDMVPMLLNSIRRCLPGEHNSIKPKQIQLYRAFRQGDRMAVMDMPRSLREQVFLTTVRCIFTDNLNQDFDELLLSWSSGQNQPQRTRRNLSLDSNIIMEEDDDDFIGSRGFGRPRMPARRGRPSRFGANRQGAAGESYAENENLQSVAGFVVLLEGYTPHLKGLEFLFPPDVGNQRNQWGFFNRLRVLGVTEKKDIEDTTQNESPDQLLFETYVDTTRDDGISFHYTDGGWIDSRNPDQPAGLGILKPFEVEIKNPYTRSTRPNFQRDSRARQLAMQGIDDMPVYVDPFTYEPISVTYAKKGEDIILDDKGLPVIENHDYWFRVKFKVKLKKQPEPKNQELL
ncbi:MAG: type IV pilus assembly protein PilM [Planctomycetes bacterium]|nr:type IV pilus assembly protein PilM [Planctomycetota bacterium]